MSTVVVTGRAGTLGRYLVPALLSKNLDREEANIA